MKQGLFITFEGIDGCGKTTQLGLVSKWLESMGANLLIVREPGGTVIGEKIREILLDKKNDAMCEMTELFLYEAARAQIVSEKIVPALKEGKTVICDRFYDSTFAYQGHARGMGDKTVKMLNMLAVGNVKPDRSYVFDISEQKAFERRCGRSQTEDRLEAMGLEFQAKVREGYLDAASQEPDRIKVLDATLDINEIFETVKADITEVIK